jgi:hypothetical protein
LVILICGSLNKIIDDISSKNGETPPCETDESSSKS